MSGVAERAIKEGAAIFAFLMTHNLDPIPKDGVDARVRALLSVPLAPKGEWLKEQVATLIEEARADGASATPILGGLGGVRIKGSDGAGNRRSFIYAPTADVSQFVDEVVVDEQTNTLYVQITNKSGKKTLYSYHGVRPEEIAGLIAVIALAHTKDEYEYAVAAAQLLDMFGNDDVVRAALLKIIQGEIGAVRIKRGDEQNDETRPSVGAFYGSFIKHNFYTEMSSLPPCHNDQWKDECVERRRRWMALRYKKGTLRIQFDDLEEEERRRLEAEERRREEEERRRQEEERRREEERRQREAEERERREREAKRKKALEDYEEAYEWLDDEEHDYREMGINKLGELVYEGNLPNSKRDSAVSTIL